MAAKVPDVVHDSHQHDPNIDNAKRIPNRLILCFDGTGNSFQGNPADTNIVKLMDMFDRSATRQMHYYQRKSNVRMLDFFTSRTQDPRNVANASAAGIGTYTSSESVNQGFIGRIKKFVTQTIDCGLATSFDSHVIAGYRFLMRYYGMGDRIYIFGFSRGAFTARFLARMISAVGLLSMGNEEMVPFAYKVYQDYEMNLPNAQAAEAYSKTFRRAFCRHEGDEGIKVHFLGLFDTVNSVGTFDVGLTGNMKAPDVIGTAEHVRHAVAIDERRVKFKAALLAQDERSNESDPEDSKEVWFPGNHGDIGGGWPAEDEEPKKPLTIWQRIKRAVSKTKDLGGAHLHKEHDHFQLSDFALKWMIDELDDLNTKLKTDTLRWNEQKADFVRRFVERRPKAIRARMHDTMTFGRGSSFGKALLWKLMGMLCSCFLYSLTTASLSATSISFKGCSIQE